MTLLQGALLGFALWTLAILTLTVGVHRWSHILTGRARIHEFPADAPAGPDWYKRGTRAHLNCVENLPVFSAIVLTAPAAAQQTPLIDGLAIAFLGFRIAQSTTHIAFKETARTVSIRFSCFMLQVAIMIALVVLLWWR
ncbi:MAG TPA: MAPEG family protein [Polyangiaceae bacterium]|nr:MAPEG family protein [Polyangiaceae bacterium]